MSRKIKCEVCGREVTARTTTKRFCSSVCQQTNSRREQGIKPASKPFERTCKACGCVVKPKRTTRGKLKGTVYYTKLCEKCLFEGRSAKAKEMNKNRDYDKSRKFFSKKCAYCGRVFSVKGHPDSRRVKMCSKECHRKAISERNIATGSVDVLHKTRHKGWAKTFERPQTVPGLAMGEAHCKALKVSFIDPSNIVHHVINVTDFVRKNPHLFNEEDVQWTPNKKESKVPSLNFKQSHAVGTLVCRASSGLLKVARGDRGSWKGWQLKKEMYK